MVWDDPAVSLLRRLIAGGLTASQIGRQLGATRNAVIGKASRLGLSIGGGASWAEHHRQRAEIERGYALPRRASVRSGPKVKRAAGPVTATTWTAGPRAPLPKGPTPEPATSEAPSAGAGVAFFDLRDRQCRFPLWRGATPRPVSSALFCGAPTPEKCSWCDTHLEIVSGRPQGSLSDAAMDGAAKLAVKRRAA